MHNIERNNEKYVNAVYNVFLQKRFGINSCSVKPDMVILHNKIVLDKWKTYRDVSSPIIADRLLVNDCRKICAIPNGLWDNNYTNVPYSPVVLTGGSTPIVTPPVVVIQAPPRIPIIEVKVGTPEAIAAGIIEGSLLISNQAYKDREVEIFRSNVNVPMHDRGDGDPYFTKPDSSVTITLSNPLQLDEWIKIKVF